MILPITAYGHPTLRKETKEIDRDYPGLQELIENMFETMHTSVGVGLAAPQVDIPIRLFIVDGTPYGEEMPEAKDFREVFINPKIVEEEGEEWTYNEGCLSIPELREDVSRKPRVRLQYYDRDWNFHDTWFDSLPARIIQHEYDHLEGIMFTDRINPLRKVMIRKKLADISEGRVSPDYRMKFPVLRKKKKR